MHTGALLLCDIGSTFNAQLKPCDRTEWLRSVQPSHNESPLHTLKANFERYWMQPPDITGTELAQEFPSSYEKLQNLELLRLLEVPLSQKGGLLKAKAPTYIGPAIQLGFPGGAGGFFPGLGMNP